MDLKLTVKVALVTGSTAGIGFAIAQALAAEGAHVYVNRRTQERVDAAVVAIRSRSGKVDGIAADFSSLAGAEAVIAELPVVEVLVNNVGIIEPKPFAEITELPQLLKNLVDVTGIEPVTPCLQIQKANSDGVKADERE